jgi:general L-amino acid transport system permease protein
MSDLSYVRTEMLPEKEPPVGQSGIILWMRTNLFSGWVNSIVTVVVLYFLWAVLSEILPWFWNGIWVGDSLTECRAIRDERGLESTACWAVIRERWNQLLFGFYPKELYWRAVLALVLLFVAISPVLFDRVPRKFFLFTAVYPFLLVFLIWGGSIWGPLMAMAGFGVGYLAYRLIAPHNALVAMIAAFVVPIIWWIWIAGPLAGTIHSVIPIGWQPVASKFISGFMISVIIGVSGIALSLPLGIVLALGRQSDMFIVRTMCIGFIEFVRGVPLITLLFVAQLLLNYFLPKGTNFDIIVRVIIMVTLFSAAYMAETIRGGLAALPRGQYEAGDSLGLNYWQAQQLIIMPQALKISIPSIVGIFIGLFKDTTLVAFISISDMLAFTNLIRSDTSWNGIYWELFIFVAFVFWICCFSMSRYSMYLERKLQTDHD